MKRILLLAVLGLCVLAPARALAAEEAINAFDVEASLNRGDDLLVKERIAYDFSDNQRHGIFRHVPETLVVSFRKIQTGLRWLTVLRDGAEEPYTVESVSGDSLAKVGDANVTIQGEHVYELTYSLGRSVVATDGVQRFSWNVTGDNWEVPMKSSSFVLDTPASPTRVQCFTGYRGSIESDCTVSAVGGRITARLTRALEPKEGWTVEAIYPEGTFIPAGIETKPLLPWLRPGVILGTLFSLFWFLVWFKFGRDPKGRGTIIPEFNPPEGAKPYEVNAMMVEGGNHRALSATIIDLARRGALSLIIEDEGESYRIERKRDGERNLDAYEQKVIEMLFLDGDEFTVSTSDAKRSTLTAKLGWMIPNILVTKGWHHWNIGLVRGLSVVAVIGTWIISFAVASVYFGDPYLFVSVVGLIVGLVFAQLMPRRTKQGSIMLEQIKGFKEYIRVAEKDRLKFHEAPARTPERFSALLPFAVALGLEKEWGKLFADIVLPNNELGTSSSVLYASQIGMVSHHISDDVRSFVASSSSSGGGGGGSSGGGGGGGGGGSW